MTERQFPDTGVLAKRFADVLKGWLTEAQWAEMRRRNATEEYSGDCCASHDFCDANMAMDQAFRDLGHASLIEGYFAEDQEVVDLWGKAWDIAKKEYLTA